MARFDFALRPFAWRGLPWAEERDSFVREVWLERALDDDWTVAFRLMEQDGALVVGELRVFPAEPGRKYPGRWSAETRRLGVDASVPRGGLTARRLRRVRLDVARQNVRDALEEVRARARRRRAAGESAEAEAAVAEMLAPFRVYDVGRVTKRPAGGRRRQWSDLELAQLAAQYREKVVAGRNPIVELAGERGYSPAGIRQALRTARRERGLLTETRRGVAGGDLTDKARALLEEVE